MMDDLLAVRAADLLAVQAARYLALDPLLPPAVSPDLSGPLSGPDDVLLTAELPGGDPVLGLLRRIVFEEGTPISLWSTLVCWQLYPLVGVDPGAGMTALLGAWRRHMATVDLPLDDETSYRVSWPSRDTVGSAPLLRIGFQPVSAFAVRVGSGSSAVTDSSLPSDVTVRRATVGDLGEATRISMAEMAYSVTVGNTYLRPDADAIRAQSLRRRIEAGDPVLVAERDGVLVGVADCFVVESGAAGGWPPVPAGRWGYVALLSVLPSVRGGGVGRALMAVAHREFARLGVIGTCLYYNPPNPLSSVFWPRQGYRPLWTVWEARPAWALR